jgi:hypothetical protein
MPALYRTKASTQRTLYAACIGIDGIGTEATLAPSKKACGLSRAYLNVVRLSWCPSRRCTRYKLCPALRSLSARQALKSCTRISGSMPAFFRKRYQTRMIPEYGSPVCGFGNRYGFLPLDSKPPRTCRALSFRGKVLGRLDLLLDAGIFQRRLSKSTSTHLASGLRQLRAQVVDFIGLGVKTCPYKRLICWV